LKRLSDGEWETASAERDWLLTGATDERLAYTRMAAVQELEMPSVHRGSDFGLLESVESDTTAVTVDHWILK
jgi:hypothetical protein